MSIQNYDHKPVHELITGTSGTGKTTLWEKLLRAQHARVKWIFDHQGEFASRFGFPAVVDMEGLYKATAIGGWVIFDPIRLQDETVEVNGKEDRLGVVGAFRIFCKFVFEASKQFRGRKIFACDELQMLTEGKPNDCIAIFDSGRRFQLDVYCIAQAFNVIHNRIRDQVTKVYAFQQVDDNAIKFLKSNGFDEKEIRALQPGQYLWKHLRSGEVGEGGKAF